ncbi:MAG: lysine--tRNA ligase, partial [Clostridia bacterium]|nr:lysine--tRNA ligase [Clostridia bacterium]
MAEELNNTPVTEGEESVGSVLEVRRNKLFELQKADMDPYMEVKYDITAYAADIKENFDAMDGQTVSMAGRIMSRRD